MNYWIMKTEPDTFGIDDLKNTNNQKTSWEGVRNYQARNFMRDEMKLGDKVYIYHSSCKEIGIAGLATVCKESHPDLTAQDPKSGYFDPKATKDNPRWFMVDLKFLEKFKRILSLNELKDHKELENMPLVKKGNRLSIIPISEKEFNYIYKLSSK